MLHHVLAVVVPGPVPDQHPFPVGEAEGVGAEEGPQPAGGAPGALSVSPARSGGAASDAVCRVSKVACSTGVPTSLGRTGRAVRRPSR